MGLTATKALGNVAGSSDSSGIAITANLAEPPTSGYLRPPIVLATSPGIYIVNPTPAAATPEATAQATAEATPEAIAEPQPAFVVYTVQDGDSLAAIAAAYGVGVEYILWNNTDLSDDPDLLVPGQKLLIPTVNGLIYHVRLGDTLSDIASYYQIDVQSILAFGPNAIASPDSVIEGMVLVLPGATPPPPPIPAAVAAVDEPAPAAEPAASQPAPAPAPAPPPVSAGYVWPFSGPISTYYGEPRGGGSYHLAIDIDAFGRYGAPVVAAASGTVTLVAYDSGGLGTHVQISHADGSSTVYAHLSAVYVSQGQAVGQGQQIGAIGCTGYCTGPHLHFELWIGGHPVDPLLYLP